MKLRKFTLLTLLITSLSVTGCAEFLNNLVSPNVPRPTDLNPVSLKYTNEDLYARNLYDIDCFPSLGTPKGLVIPVWFPDSSIYVFESKKENVLNDIESAFNGDVEDIGGYESVRSYYKELSKGLLDLEFIISDWYYAPKSAAYYGSGNALGTLENLVKTATDWYFSTYPSEDRKDFDYNSDGVLDGVIFVYAAPDYSALGNSNYENLWAFVGWQQDTSNRSVNKPILNQYMWASYDFMYNSNTAKSRAGTEFASGDTRYCKIDTHTYIHEFGHLLGLEDYYDYGYEGYTPAGVFSMQDYNVGSHDPFSTIALGWTKVIVPSETCTLELESFQDTNTVVLLTNEYTGSTFDEYFLVELYTPNGLNAFDVNYRYENKVPSGPKLPGIRLWHIDARLGVFSYEGNSVYFNGFSTEPTRQYGSNKNPYYYFATSNTYDGEIGSILVGIVDGVVDMNIVQLIRSDTRITYRPRDFLTYDNMFTAGETFSMEKYQSQFVNGTKLNSGSDFTWSFKVNSVSSEKANITFTLG